ncbi:MAG TPA: hypothetical protein VI685_11505 [Candidatus Angelobacter sp.]
MRLTLPARLAVLGVLLSAPFAAHGEDRYEAAVQRALGAMYSMDDQTAQAALHEMQTLRPDFPAPLVYQELLDAWRAAEDPLNEALTSRFEKDADKAIEACLKWTHDHAKDAEGWRYLASAYGQRARFAEKIRFSHFNAARYGLKTRKAVDTAYALDKSDADILVGVGGAHYFGAHLPFTLRMFAWLLGIHGDREAGLRELTRAMQESRHSRVEAAIVLAGAYWTENDYEHFRSTIAEVSSRYPELLSVRAWQVEGLICSDKLSDPSLDDTIDRAPAGNGWKWLERGRIALAQGDFHSSSEFFSQAISSPDSNLSVKFLACKGMERATHKKYSDSMAGCPRLNAPDEIYNRTFPTPGKCRH